jgi:hypothetical protein
MKISVLAASFLLFTACSDKVPDTGTVPTDADVDADADTDADTAPVTSVGMQWYAGDAQTSGANFVGGHFGFLFTDLDKATVCTDLSSWSEAGSRAPECPQCDWAFNLTTSRATVSGAPCDTFGSFEGFTGSWGFAANYTYVNPTSYNSYDMNTVVLYYSVSDRLWFPLAYNMDGYGYNTGDASDVTFMRLYAYTYYYP